MKRFVFAVLLSILFSSGVSMPRKDMKLVHNAAAADVTTVPKVKQGKPSEVHVTPRPDPASRTQRVVKAFAFESHAPADDGHKVKPSKPHKGHGRKKVAPDTPWSVTTFQGQGIGMTSLAG